MAQVPGTAAREGSSGAVVFPSRAGSSGAVVFPIRSNTINNRKGSGFSGCCRFYMVSVYTCLLAYDSDCRFGLFCCRG